MNRRMIAFQSAMFTTVMTLPFPVDNILIPFFVGLKLYNLMGAFFLFKFMVNPQISMNLVNLLLVTPNYTLTFAESAATTLVSSIPILKLTTATRTLTATMSPYDTSGVWLLIASMDLVVIATIIGELAIIYILLVYPTIYIRRNIYPRVQRMMR